MYFKVFWQRQAENLPSRCVRRLLVQLLSHERPDGTEVVDLGYGENIARGQSSASEVMKDWMKSEGHRYNILWDQYHSIGVAHSGGYWVQVFSFYSNHQNCRHPSGRQLSQLPLSQKLESHQGFLRFWGFGS